MFTVKLKTLMEEFHLEPVCMTESAGDIDITTSDVNRPGLQLSGYMEYFGSDRIQIIGKVEMTYLASLSPQERQKRLDEYFRTGFPVLSSQGIRSHSGRWCRLLRNTPYRS